VQGRSSGVGAKVVAGIGEEGAPMSGRAVLWLEAEAREVAQGGEGKSRRGGEKLGRRQRGSLLKGEPAGRQRRRGRVSQAMR
jgi:hypothetical protein